MKPLRRCMLRGAFLALIIAMAVGCSSDQTAIPSATAPATARPSPVATVGTVATATATPPAEPTAQPTVAATLAPTPTSPAEPAAEPSQVPTPEPVEPLGAVDQAITSLQGLPIDAFFEQSYRQLLRRSPEALTAMGMSAEFGLRDDQLDNLSDAYLRETQALESAILELLNGYDRAELAAEQKISYDVYQWFLDSQVRGHEFAYHNYPLTGFIGSYEFDLDLLLTEYHPLGTKANAEDYVARLWQVDDQVEQLFEGLRIREERGVIPPGYIVTAARNNLVHTLGMRSPDPATIKIESLRLYSHFAERIAGIDDLSDDDKESLLASAQEAIEGSLIPAYTRLIEYLDHLKTIATSEAGVWKLPEGERYYAYLLHRETSTDLSPAEIHQIGLDEVARIEQEMRQELAALGYPSDQSLPELMGLMIDDAGYYDISTQSGRDRYIADIEKLIAGAEEAVEPVFDLRPQWGVIVIGGPTGGYYVAGAADGSRPGSYHVSLEGTVRPRFVGPTAVYHETVPGHHYQIAVAQSLDLPLFRTDLVFNAYAEGWALYAERLAWELGLYQDDPYGNLGRLEYELLRAVRLVVDTGIHAMRWTREEGGAYMAKHVMPWMNEVDRYVVMPAQATGYKIGMLEVMRLRQEAMDRLGERFDLKAFHNAVLGHGSMPLPLLATIIEEATGDTLASAP
jgi:uncharacterized protein (DUF885 family)